MSQPANTRSLSSPSGTNFLICGDLPSVRFPSRIVPSCVSDPTGCDSLLRTSSTPAMNVVLTAPIPGNKTPSFPLAGSIFRGLSIPLLSNQQRFSLVPERLSRSPGFPVLVPKAVSGCTTLVSCFSRVCLSFHFFFLPTKLRLQGGAITPKQTSNDERSPYDLQ